MRDRYSLRDYTDTPDFPFSIIRLSHNRHIAPHVHDFTELVVVTSGSARHSVDGEEYPLRAGDVFVVTVGGSHGYVDASDLELANIMFDADLFVRENPDLRTLPGFHSLFVLEPRLRKDHRFESRLTLGHEDSIFAQRLCVLIEAELRDRTDAYRTAIRTYLRALLVFLARRYASSSVAGPPSARRLHDIAASVAWLERNFRDEVSLAELAGRAHLSPRQYDRVFKNAVGLGPKAYQIELRLSRACELLEQGAMTISSIAADCGFSSPNFFSRQFSRRFGMPPSEYREAHAGNVHGSQARKYRNGLRYRQAYLDQS